MLKMLFLDAQHEGQPNPGLLSQVGLLQEQVEETAHHPCTWALPHSATSVQLSISLGSCYAAVPMLISEQFMWGKKVELSYWAAKKANKKVELPIFKCNCAKSAAEKDSLKYRFALKAMKYWCMDKPSKHYGMWKKLDSKTHILCDSIYMQCPEQVNT